MFNTEPIVLTFGTNLLFVIEIASAAIIRNENPCRVHLIGILIIVFAILSGLAREVKRSFAQKGLSQQGQLTQAAETGQAGVDIGYRLFTDDVEVVAVDDDDFTEHPLLKLYDVFDYSNYFDGSVDDDINADSNDANAAGPRIYTDPSIQAEIIMI